MSQAEAASSSALPDLSEGFLRRVSIRNYKSIGKCDVQLGRLTVLVGRNGSGKSNFLDALRFVADGLQSSLDHAIKSRGGVKVVRRQSTGHPRNFSVQLEFNLSDWHVGRYGFEIAARTEAGFSVKHESLEVIDPRGQLVHFYRVDDGRVESRPELTLPPATRDRLYLVVASGLPMFRPAYDSLTSMGFYNLNPEAMKELQSPDAGELLIRDGGNIASVIARLEAESPQDKERAEVYLGKIVPGIEGVDRVQLGPRETLQFRQMVVGAKDPWKFFASSMSDGTLRAMGVLIAVSQLAHAQDRVRVVGIEEPETALHPAAARALMDALREASEHTQVLVTTHSADLLEAIEGDASNTLLAVQAQAGETRIAPVDAASRESIRKHLFSAGDLLRMDQLEPDQADLLRQQNASLFDFSEA